MPHSVLKSTTTITTTSLLLPSTSHHEASSQESETRQVSITPTEPTSNCERAGQVSGNTVAGPGGGWGQPPATRTTGEVQDAGPDAFGYLVRGVYRLSSTIVLGAQSPISRLAVVPQVFSHLDPRELLILTRTSKELRTVLTRPNCAFVWRTSRALVGLVDPTKCFANGISELAFASLLFSNHCGVRYSEHAATPLDSSLLVL